MFQNFETLISKNKTTRYPNTLPIPILISLAAKANKMFYFHLNVFLINQAEARAEFAERSVQKLQKEVDRLEGKHLY